MEKMSLERREEANQPAKFNLLLSLSARKARSALVAIGKAQHHSEI
jgi:hypothetical protein